MTAWACTFCIPPNMWLRTVWANGIERTRASCALASLFFSLSLSLSLSLSVSLSLSLFLSLSLCFYLSLSLSLFSLSRSLSLCSLFLALSFLSGNGSAGLFSHAVRSPDPQMQNLALTRRETRCSKASHLPEVFGQA